MAEGKRSVRATAKAKKKPAKKPAGKKPAGAKAGEGKAGGESDILQALAAMKGTTDRTIGERIHAIIKANAPDLTPRLWYGMPAYSRANGKVVCFFQSARKFKTRYATLGFMHESKLDDGHMWPVAFAVTQLTPAEEERIVALVRKALG
jgi:uncharacterized protein YdhG (YjbR/CyaY superfamily)